MEVNNSVKNLVKNTEGEVRRIQESEEPLITADMLRSTLKGKVNEETIASILEQIKWIEERDNISQDYFEEQFMTHVDLMGPGISSQVLINAIKFVALVQAGMTNHKAYNAVFPEKAAQVAARGSNTSSFAAEYAKKKTVVEIMKRSIIRDDIRHAPLRDKMLSKLVDLSNGRGAKEDDYVSPTVQLNATLGALDYLKAPEDKSIDLKIGYSEEAKAMQQDIFAQLAQNAQLMREQFEAGRSLRDVQKINIIVDAEIEEN